MDIKVDLDAHAINAEIQKAIAESAIGEELKRVITESVEKLSKSWDNPIKAVVDRMIMESIRTMIEKDYSEQVKDFVKKSMDEKFMTDMINSLWQAWAQRAKLY